MPAHGRRFTRCDGKARSPVERPLLFDSRSDGSSAGCSNDVVAHVENFHCGYRFVAVSACCEYRVGGHPLRSDEGTARVVTVVQEGERIVPPAVIPLPHSMAGTTLRRARPGTDAPLRHRPPVVECGESDDGGRSDRLARLTVDESHNCSPGAHKGLVRVPRRSERHGRDGRQHRAHREADQCPVCSHFVSFRYC